MEATPSSVAGAAAPGTPVLGAARRRYGEAVIKVLLILATVISVATTVGIVVSLLKETIDFFTTVDTGVGRRIGVGEFLTGDEWSPTIKPFAFGVLPLVNGTLLITGIALIVAIPLGLGAAIYLSEYARPGARKALKPVLEVLAGIPTIVFGYFALAFFTPEILQGLFGPSIAGFNALAAGIVMGFMVLPTIASVSEDAMSAVPGSLREGAFGLGASRMQVALRVVFPAALSGIVAAIVLGVSRAIGETMIVVLAAGLSPNLGIDPREGYETMTTFIASTAKGDIPTESIKYQTIFAVGSTLFFLTLVLNAISIRFVNRYRQVYE